MGLPPYIVRCAAVLCCRWDRNGDGSIDSKEFRVCMRNLGGIFKTVPVGEIDAMFASLECGMRMGTGIGIGIGFRTR